MTRGEIWWADLGIPLGSEPGFRRPVLVIQDDAFNKSAINTVIVASITSNLHVADAPGNVRLDKKRARLSRDSVINVSQIATLDKSRFLQKVSRLADDVIQDVERGIRLVTGMNEVGE